MKKSYILGLVVLFFVAFGLGTGTGILIQRINSLTLNVSRDSVTEFQLIEDAWNITRDHYVDRTATQPKTMLSSMNIACY